MLVSELLLCVCPYLSVQSLVKLYQSAPCYRSVLRTHLSRCHTSMEILDAYIDDPDRVGQMITANDLSVPLPELTPLLIEKYAHYVDWSYISGNSTLTPEFITQHADKLDFVTLSTNPVITHDLILRYIDRWDWYDLSSNPVLFQVENPLPFLERFYEKLCWVSLSENKALFQHPRCVEIIDAYLDWWRWSDIQDNLVLTIDIMAHYYEKWDWDRLSKFGRLTPTIVEAYLSRWNWFGIGGNKHLTIEDKRPYLSRFREVLQDPYIGANDFWKHFSKGIPLSSDIIDWCFNHPCWRSEVINNPSLTVEIFERHISRWDSFAVCRSEVVTSFLTPDLFAKVLQGRGAMYWSIACGNIHAGRFLTPDIIDRYDQGRFALGEDDWCELSDNREWLTPELVLRYSDKIIDEVAIKNPALTLDFVITFFGPRTEPKLFGSSLSERKDVTISFILAHPEIPWAWDMFTGFGTWTWVDVLEYPHLPWDISYIFRC